MSAMLTLEEAQRALLALAPKRTSTSLELTPEFPKRFLAEDVCAQRTQPSANLSAMDGYAVTPGSGPWQKVGESRAGTPFVGELCPGECTRISTGAHVPNGANRILIQENAVVDGTLVSATENVAQGRHIRKAGFDFSEGDIVLRKGTEVTPGVLALAISSGQCSLPVTEPPTVAVLDSGDELVPLGQPAGLNQIPASNGAMIAAMLNPYVGSILPLGPVPDDRNKLAHALRQSESSDVLITTGGASVGDHDLIQQALKDWGADLAFWKVAIKPGKPLMVATRGKQVIVGLPGNPVSSFVTCFLFVLPLIRASMGDPSPLPKRSVSAAGEALPAVGKRHEFLRGQSDGNTVGLMTSQDSSGLAALANADCLIDRPARAGEVREGDLVSVYNLQNG